MFCVNIFSKKFTENVFELKKCGMLQMSLRPLEYCDSNYNPKHFYAM